MYLRDWLIAQKSLYQEANCETDLDWERHDLLDDIGMDWEKSRLAENPIATHIERRGIIMNSATWMCRRIIMT